MTEKQSNFIITALVLLLPIIAFGAGWLANEYFDTVWPDRVTASTGAADSGLLWEAWGHVRNDFIGEVPGDQQALYGAIRGALALLNDPYTVFLEPVAREEEQINLRGNYGGIGAYIARNEAGEAVLTIIPGNPAEAAGIRDGDVLLAIDGEPILPEMSAEVIAQLIRGEIGSEVTLTVRHAGESGESEIAIIRGEILVPSVIARVLPEQPTVGYVQLSRFSGESAGELEAAVENLLNQQVDRLILDLRGNPGGLLDAAIEIADQFLAGGTVMIQESRGSGEKLVNATRRTPYPDIPLAVLIDGGTASAAEILAGALGDRGRAQLIGQRTFGKGSVQLVYDLSDGSSVHVTSARWYTPNRQPIDQQGLAPDLEVIPSPEDVAAGRDEILESAVEMLTSP